MAESKKVSIDDIYFNNTGWRQPWMNLLLDTTSSWSCPKMVQVVGQPLQLLWPAKWKWFELVLATRLIQVMSPLRYLINVCCKQWPRSAILHVFKSIVATFSIFFIGRSLPIAITRALTFIFLQCGYQHVGLIEFYPVIHSLWWSDTYIAVHVFPLFCSILWNSLSLRLEFCNDWSCYKGWEICLGHSPSISLHSTTCQ